MKVELSQNKKEINEFLTEQNHSQFLQSSNWGEFNCNSGTDFWHLLVKEEETLSSALLIKKKLPFRSYFYCPKGPVIKSQILNPNFKETANLLFEEIKKIAKNEKCIFFRFEPEAEPKKILHKKWKFKKTIDVQPSKTIILDLEKPEAELLKNMSQKTRYNIRLAEKKNVKIKKAGPKEFEAFWKLINETKDRDNFRLHGKNYYGAMLDIPGIELFIAEYDSKMIAAAIVSIFGDTASYLHGASSNHDRQVMAPHLLQWEIIKQAKQNGCKFYDLNGIDENKWPGVTRFKRGFGGMEIKFPGTFDLIFNPFWYEVYKIVRKVRRIF